MFSPKISKQERLYDCQNNDSYNKISTGKFKTLRSVKQVTKEHKNYDESINNVTNINAGLQLMEVA